MSKKTLYPLLAENNRQRLFKVISASSSQEMASEIKEIFTSHLSEMQKDKNFREVVLFCLETLLLKNETEKGKLSSSKQIHSLFDKTFYTKLNQLASVE